MWVSIYVGVLWMLINSTLPPTFFSPSFDVVYICTFSSKWGQEGNDSISYTLG